jgi:hypothetical protein
VAYLGNGVGAVSVAAADIAAIATFVTNATNATNATKYSCGCYRRRYCSGIFIFGECCQEISLRKFGANLSLFLLLVSATSSRKRFCTPTSLTAANLGTISAAGLVTVRSLLCTTAQLH